MIPSLSHIVALYEDMKAAEWEQSKCTQCCMAWAFHPKDEKGERQCMQFQVWTDQNFAGIQRK